MPDDPRRLPCGTDLAELTRQVFDGVAPIDPDHQRDCPHCRRALRRIRAVADDVRGVATEPVEVPRTLLASVMARVRSRPSLITIELTDLGRTNVADHVVGVLAREAAVRVEGVRHASVLASERSPDGVDVRARLVIAYGPVMPLLAERVRKAIAAALEGEIGTRPGSIDILIDDLA